MNANAKGPGNDDCRASCVDWYGNARALFIKGRIFALLGYDIVKGVMTGSGIRENVERAFHPPDRLRIRRGRSVLLEKRVTKRGLAV
ncbi:MAG: hypothetical protein HKN25_16340 [Pyrinomonadaceae bacterium]|nr:hypothetical protein [Pyrinomonadaceae bacterium]